MKLRSKLRIHTRGSALAITMLTVAVLVSIAGTVLFRVNNKYRNLSQATSWRKALVAAESGVDVAMQRLQDNATTPASAWSGWSTTDPFTGQTLANNGRCYSPAALSFGGEGGNTMSYYVVVDTPTGLARTRTTKQYYRIRSSGYADIAGGNVAGDSRLDVDLRKLSFKRDRRTNQALTKARASRTIEVVAAPYTEVLPFNVAHAKWELESTFTAKAYDSSTSQYSTNGKYDPTKTMPASQAGPLLHTNQWTKDYEKKGTLEKVDLKASTIVGDFSALAGPIKNGQNIQGSSIFNVSVDLPKVLPPTWTIPTENDLPTGEIKLESMSKTRAAAYTAWTTSGNPTLTAKAGSKGLVLYGSASSSSPTTVKADKLKADASNETLAIVNPVGASESWVEIYTTSEFKVKDGGNLLIEDGVHVTIYFEKLFKVRDKKNINGGTFVESGYPGDLLVKGIELPESDKVTDDDFSAVKTSGKVKIKDSAFTGIVFAPDYDMEVKSKSVWGPDDYINGSLTGRKIKIKGDTDFVTDHSPSLSQAGQNIVGYRVASWFEDSE